MLNQHFKAALALALLGLTQGAQGAIERVVLATQSWPPYQVEQDGKLGGIAIERVQCAFRQMRQPYELRMMRWDKAQLEVQSYQFDDKPVGFFSGSNNSSRSRYAEPSMALISAELAWFLAPGVNLQPATEQAKTKARYGAKFNTSKWLFLKKNGYNVVKKPRSADSLLRMLWQGEVDVALEYTAVFEQSMKQQGIPLDTFTRVPYRTQNLSVHFSKVFLKRYPTFLASFNQALASCKK